MKSLATIALLFFTGILLAQPNLEWSKNYGGSGDDIADQILTTSNGYFISGSTTSQDGDFVDNPYDTAHFILKLDHQGLINWIHFYHEEVISIALDQKENLIFLKELDLSTIHLEKIDHQGVTIYNDQIISVNRTVIPIDLAMHSENEIKIIGNLASGFSQDGVFSCIYNEQNRNTEFIYQPRYYTGGINNFINYYIGIEEFFNTEMVVGFVWFDRAQTATLFPRKLEEICNFGNSHSLAFDMEVVASSDGSILVGCDELLKVYQDTIYSIGFNGPKKPLAGNKRYNWVYQQFDDDFLILAVNNEGDSLYTLNYNGSEIDQILDAAIATDEGLVLFMNSNSNDGDFPINNGGQDLWVSKFINSDTICLTFANTSFETCPQDSFLLNPFISGCENCSYTWEDNSTNINRWVDAQTSDTFILNISNGINIDTIINIELLISQLTNLEYDIEYIGDCPGEEVKIKFDTSTCNGCIIKENFRPLDTNVISLYPLKDEIAVFNLQLGSCFSKFEIPLDIYDFEARVKHSFCGDSNSLEVLPIGGNGNININWEDGSTDFIRNDLEPGFHSFTLSDSLCSIGDSTTQSQFLIPFADFAFSTKPLDSSGFNYFISTEEEYIDLNTTLYNYFLVKAKEGVVFDFAKIVVHPYWEFFNIDIIDNKIHVKELEYGNRNYIFDFDLSLLDSSIPQNPIRINYFENKVSRIENGDTLWTQSFENRINNFAINTDSSELIVCGREILKFVNYNSGEVLLTRDVGGSNYENITAVKIREGRIFGVGTTNSNDGDLLNVNLDDSLSTKLWIFEIDRSQNFKWQYLIDQGASANLHLFKEGLLVTVGGKTYRFSSEGQFVWSYNEKMFLRSVEDTIIFDSRIFYDTFDESRIFRDSLNLDQDSTISVNSIPGSNILWSTGDTTSTITVSDPGTYTVQIESPDGCVTLDTIIVFARSVANYELDLKDYEIQVYPNPNNGEFIVESEAKIQSIRIVNAMGKVMQQVQFPIGVNNHRINLDNDFTGLYILQCRINNSWHSKKIITMNQ